MFSVVRQVTRAQGPWVEYEARMELYHVRLDKHTQTPTRLSVFVPDIRKYINLTTVQNYLPESSDSVASEVMSLLASAYSIL